MISSLPTPMTPNERIIEIIRLLNIEAVNKETIARLEKDLKQQVSYTDLYRNNDAAKQSEIEQVHLLMDALPQKPPRELVTGTNSWDNKQLTLMTRLTILLIATR
jgi:hypothetical protein